MHAVLVIGYDQNDNWYVKNSIARWGENGFGYVRGGGGKDCGIRMEVYQYDIQQ